MKTCIYAFSGTGTALSIADHVCDVIGDASVKLIPGLMENTGTGELIVDVQKIGFVFPNYFGGIPNTVRSFIRQLNMENVKYIFAIVPAGGGQGYSLKFLQEELQKRGKTLDYGRYAMGLSNYIVAGYYGLVSKVGKERERAVDSLRIKINMYAEEIKSDKRYVQRSNPLIYTMNRVLSTLSSRDVLKGTSSGDMHYSAGSNCLGCGTCMKVCQANNIVMSGKKPSFQHKCYRCMACIQYCPRNAILFKGKELKKPQYTHPDFPADKMINRIRESSNNPLMAKDNDI